MRWVRNLALAVLIAGAALPVNSSANEYALTRARTLYNQMRDDAQCEAALPTARQFWASSDFATLSGDVRQAFLNAVVLCAAGLNDYQASIAAARAAKALNAPWADYVLMLLGLDAEDDALAVQSFDEVAARSPHYIAPLELRTVWRVLNAARDIDATGARRLRVHEELLRLRYTPPQATTDDGLRRDHAQLLLARGDVTRAQERLSTVTDPHALLEIRITREYDALRSDPSFEERYNLTAAAERQLVRSRETAAANPRLLGPSLDVVQTLRLLGRNQEALTEADRVLERAQSPQGPQLFEDHADQLNWLLNERGYTLYDLGRRDEARSTFGSAIGAGEGGHWNVSQVINFASRLQAEGRAQEALDVVSTMGRASPYGDMWAAAVKACAGQQLANTAVRDEGVAFLRANENVNPAALTRGLLCINDLDGAAAAYVRRLASDEHRGGALLALQIYPPPAVVMSDFDAEVDRRKAIVRDRADVRAAVERVGRIEQVPLYAVYWGES